MFTQPCFIRKNTTELRKKLEELGYISHIFNNNDANNLYVDKLGTYISVDIENQPHYIDCGTNEELFLALAALRDDTDKNQWVIDEANECFGWEDSWMICDKDDMNERSVYTHYRKATVEEIIEHFK